MRRFLLLLALPAFAFAAPEPDAFKGRITNVADEPIAGAYVCAKSDSKEVCALSGEDGRVELPVMAGPLSVEVVASTLGPVKMTLQRKARTNTVTCEKKFTSQGGKHAVVTCSFEG